MKNYRYKDSDIDKGFVQGFTAGCAAFSNATISALPRRYLTALKELSEDGNTIVTTADKGGGVVLMDYSDYKSKMFDLLSDKSTYRKTGAGHAEKDAKKF